jgi:hypothetical protein
MAAPGWTQTMDVDFSRVVRHSGPYMFGGAHIPPASHPGALQALRAAGVSHVRFDISLADIVPANTTVAAYLANQGGVANPAGWNWALESEIRRVREAGLAAYGVLLWNPAWLTRNGKSNGEVVDYRVWEDIVRKVLTRLGSRFAYIEIWNEPCWTDFLDLGPGSSVERITQVTLEYHRHALHAAEGLGLKLGGPVGYGWWRDTLLQAALSDEYIRSHLGFVSWHHYDQAHFEYTDFERTVALVRRLAGRDIEMHVSEWNYSGDRGSYPEFQNGPHAAAWVGKKLIEFYRLGVDSATMYHLSNGPWGYEYQEGNGKWGGYEWRDGAAHPYRFLATFAMFGKMLGLAQPGEVSVVESQPAVVAGVTGVGLKNAAQGDVILLASHGSTQAATLSIRVRTPASPAAALAIKAFSSSGSGRVLDAASLLHDALVVPKNGYAVIHLEVPPYTALGLRLEWKASLPATRDDSGAT